MFVVALRNGVRSLTVLLVVAGGVLGLSAPHNSWAAFPNSDTVWSYCYFAGVHGEPVGGGGGDPVIFNCAGNGATCVDKQPPAAAGKLCTYTGQSSSKNAQCYLAGLPQVACVGSDGVQCSSVGANSGGYPQNGVMCYPTAPALPLSIAPEILVFGEQLVATSSTVRTFTFYNPGSYAISWYGGFNTSAPFSIAQNTCGQGGLYSGQSCSVSIAFTPGSAGNFNGGLDMGWYEPTAGYQLKTLPLTGVGVTAYSGPAVQISPSTYSYPAIPYGAESGGGAFTIKNVGFSQLNISSIFAVGDFTIYLNSCGASLARDASCVVGVQFIPSAGGVRNGAIRIASNASGSPHEAALSGVGTVPNYGGAPLPSSNAGFGGGDHIGSSGPSFLSDASAKVFVEKIPVTGQRFCPAGMTCITPGGGFYGTSGGGINALLPPIPESVTGDDGEQCSGPEEEAPPSSPVASLIIEDEKEQRAIALAFLDHGTNVADPHSIFALDPIHTATGNKVHEQTDYPGFGSFAVAMHRTYNSLPFDSAAQVTQSFGPGWTSNWDRSVKLLSGGTTARVTRGDGKSYDFAVQAGGTWKPAANVASTLERVTDVAGVLTGWRYVNRGGDVDGFDANGRLATITLAKGGVYTLSYDPQLRLSAIASPFARQMTFEYDNANRVVKMSDPANGHTLYAYDTKGRLSAVTYADGKQRQYRYEKPGNAYALTSIVDESGQAYATFTYDYAGRSTGNAFAGGVGTGSILYTGVNSSSTTTPDGTAWDRTFASIGGQVVTTSLTPSCPDCGSGTDYFTYDGRGLITKHTSRRGIVTNYTYNSRGLLETTTEAAGLPEQRVTTTTWHPTLPLPLQIVRGATTTTYQYDAAGRMILETAAGGGESRSTSYAYNSIGQLTQIDGPRTDVQDIVSFTYDGQGNLASQTNAKGHVTQYSAYNAHGQPGLVAYPNGTVTSITYDTRGRTLSTVVNGRTTTYVYNVVGLLTSHTDPAGVVTSYLYDAAHRQYGIDRLGEKKRYTFDTAGRIVKTEVFDATNLLSLVNIVAYDGLGRIKARYMSNGTSLREQNFYDPDGNPISSLNEAGVPVSSTYDGLNRRATRVLSPSSGAASFGYDVNDQVISVQDPSGRATSYVNSPLGDRVATTSPDSGSSTQGVDAAGNVIIQTDARGKSSTYSYDALGRLVGVSFSDGGGITKSYDVAANGVGRLATMTDSSGSTAYTYDTLGQLASKTQTIAGVSLTLTYARDMIGRVTSVTYPSGRVATYSYQNGRVASISFGGQQAISGIEYFPFGPAESWLFGNGYEYTRFIDQNGRITKYLTPSGERRLSWGTSGVANNFLITQVQNVVSGATTGTQTFTYDDAARLASFSGYTSSSGAESQSFTYDANGNRLTSTTNGVAQTYGYLAGSNRLISVAQAGTNVLSNTYDASGNLTSDSVRSFGYDAGRRMTSATIGGVTTSYLVNGYGQRVAKLLGVTTRLFLYDEQGHFLGEYGAGGAPIQELAWFGSTPVAVYSSSMANSMGYIWTDHLETPREITDQLNQPRWKWDSLPFGETLPNQNPLGLGILEFNHRFPGQYYDAETGNHYNYFRNYDPRIGRYIESDPVGLLGGTNTYGYARQNSLTTTDPFGLQSCPIPPDPCPVLIERIEAHVAGMETKYAEMLADQYGLYTGAYSINRLPGPAGQMGTWQGHVTAYEGYRRGLKTMISDAEKLSCTVPPNAYVVADRPAPSGPNIRFPP